PPPRVQKPDRCSAEIPDCRADAARRSLRRCGPDPVTRIADRARGGDARSGQLLRTITDMVALATLATFPTSEAVMTIAITPTTANRVRAPGAGSPRPAAGGHRDEAGDSAARRSHRGGEGRQAPDQ